jgi:hypothetical protein
MRTRTSSSTSQLRHHQLMTIVEMIQTMDSLLFHLLIEIRARLLLRMEMPMAIASVLV